MRLRAGALRDPDGQQDTDDPILLVRIIDKSGNESARSEISWSLGQHDQLLEHHLVTTRSLVEAHGVPLDPWTYAVQDEK